MRISDQSAVVAKRRYVAYGRRPALHLMRLTEALTTAAALVAFVACAAALALELSHTDERVDTLVAIRDWSFLSDEAASGNLPSTPILIRNSPAQQWLKTVDGDI